MKSILVSLLVFLCVGVTFISTAQQNQVLLSGRVIDTETKLPLESISVLFSGYKIGATTDADGKFSLLLKENNYTVIFRAVGYKIQSERISLKTPINLEIELTPTEKLLDEVVISAEKADANVNRTIMGVEKISGKVLKKLPTLMGETDVIRSILLLPGVSTVGEGASGFNVRGGNVDQNLILLDGVPLYNTSHLFGFFTGFNSDLVQDLSLYKGGIPSRFGGRSSSVLDVRLKDGNFEKWGIQGGIGPIASRLAIEGPIWKDKTSILIGGRLSLSDFYLKYFPNPELKQSKANFYDLNFKITHKINQTNKLTLAAYTSDDNFQFGANTKYFWNTKNANLRWDGLINTKLSHNFTAFISDYSYGIQGIVPDFEYKWKPSLLQKSIKESIAFEQSNKSRFDFGFEINSYENNGGSYLPNSANSQSQSLIMPTDRSREAALFVGHSLKISQKISLDYGLRYTYYQLLGPGTFANYQSGTPRELSTIVNTTEYNKNQVVKSYGGLEPRFSFAYKIDTSQSIKLSFNRMQQFIHLLSNTMAISPADIWKNSNAQLPQQVTDQYSIGFFKNWGKSSSSVYETSVELYYKNIGNVIDYVDGAQLYLNRNVETQLLVGKGTAYGAEFFLKKARGVRLTGWVSYTYARSFRQISANENQIAANFGQRFPSNFDSPHNFKFVLNNRWTKRISFNANFTYSTGRPITYPNGRYKVYAFNSVYDYLINSSLIPREGLFKETFVFNGGSYDFLNRGTINEILDGYSTPSYSLRNAERIPDYIRLDIGVTLDPKENSKSNSSWNFSIYNLFSRANVYSIYFRSETGLRNQARTYQLSVLATAIPSLTYNFKF